MAAVAKAIDDRGYVLVVEDTEAIREAVIEVLRDEGIVAIGVCDGSDALALLRSKTQLPFAILTDLMMPVVDGWELIDRLKSDATFDDIQLIAMTASPLGAVPDGVPLLRKPFHVTQLLELLACP